MLSSFRRAIQLLGAAWIGITIAIPYPKEYFQDGDSEPYEVITRDVCVIGGGATGTYSAIRLRDMGKSLVVVEEKDRLGGHTETYIDPATHVPVDIGVRVFHDLDIVKNFFDRFDEPLTKAVFPPIQ